MESARTRFPAPIFLEVQFDSAKVRHLRREGKQGLPRPRGVDLPSLLRFEADEFDRVYAGLYLQSFWREFL